MGILILQRFHAKFSLKLCPDFSLSAYHIIQYTWTTKTSCGVKLHEKKNPYFAFGFPARSIPNSRKQDLAQTCLAVRIFDFVNVSLLILKIYSAVVKRILINHCINAEKK